MLRCAGMAWRSLTPTIVIVLGLLTIGIGSGGTALAWSIVLRMRFLELRDNMVGDAEKTFMDECLRDYEGLPSDDPRFKEKRKQCINELVDKDEFERRPRIRPTVDEGICDQANLCVDSDPGQCTDQGEPRDAGFKPGDVTKCFRLIETATKELEPVRASALLDQAEQTCTRSGRWKDYDRSVQLEYCMWKQMTVGACTNNLRTNCPSDSSCCPVAQNHADAEDIARLSRPDYYVCRKSPTVGLYCQHLEYRVPTNNASVLGELCTIDTCPDFEWCQDFADIPGECLGEACQSYQRALAWTLVCVIAAAAGLVFDLVDVFLLFRCPSRQKPRVVADMASACSKLMSCLCCYSGGAREFADEAASHDCFQAEGGAIAKAAAVAADGLVVTAMISVVASTCLMPFSMRVGGQLTRLPYARVK